MPEYISREAVLNEAEKVSLRDRNYRTYGNVVRSIPAADVVEVVRCRDCIYWRGENDLCKGICIDFDADGYCSEGKRKDGGQDDGQA